MLSVIVDGLWRQGNKSLAVRLVAENGEALPEWQPGAHIDVHLPCGVIRQYSLTGSCENEGLSDLRGTGNRLARRVTLYS